MEEIPPERARVRPSDPVIQAGDDSRAGQPIIGNGHKVEIVHRPAPATPAGLRLAKAGFVHATAGSENQLRRHDSPQ